MPSDVYGLTVKAQPPRRYEKGKLAKGLNMGGRGASSGMSSKGNPYGSQYETVLKSGNIKFVKAKTGSEESLLETMTAGRVYVLVGDKGPKSIIYFSKGLRRNKRIDLDHWHKAMRPHVQHGYYDNETDKAAGVKAGATKLNPDEKKMVERVTNLWDNYLNSKK